jgi:Txe/YoeB family toxin of Txe-Axe toxin-antitoxin module
LAYSTAADVRRIIHTSLTYSDITAIIELSDAQIEKRLGTQSTSDKIIKKLSMLITARTIKQRQPGSVAVGEYKETQGDLMEVWSREINELYKLYEPPIMVSSDYRHITEETRYPEGST